MQAKTQTNQERSAAMRRRLVAAGRKLFVDQGFAATGTPQIVKEAQVTRGALYHHFDDKIDLLRAVVMAEAQAVADEIRDDANVSTDPMRAGTRTYFEAMALPGRAKLLLIEGPAHLGHEEMDTIDVGAGRAALAEGIAVARPDLPDTDVARLSTALSAAYDRAALAVSKGESTDEWVATMMQLVDAATRRPG